MKYSELKRQLDKKTERGPDFKPYQKTKISPAFKPDKKIILAAVFLVLVITLWGIFFFAAEGCKAYIAGQIENWVARSQGREFEITNLEYDDLKLNGLGFAVTQVRARGIFKYDFPYLPPQHFQLRIPLAQSYFQFHGKEGLRFGMKVDGFDITSGKILRVTDQTGRRLEALTDVHFQTWVPIGWLPFQWRRQILGWARDFKRWVFAGAHMPHVYMSGNAHFVADGSSVEVYFLSAKTRSGATYLKGDAEGLRKIAQIIEPHFTEMDVEIASRNFLRTPQLLAIRTRAEEKAQELYRPDLEVSYDAYRHIFWSYFLTKTFGADFALSVTDAHEAEDSGNTFAESEKDRGNNALGIEYARRKLSENEVKEMILTDPRVNKNRAAA